MMSESKQQELESKNGDQLGRICFVIQPEEYPHEMEFKLSTPISTVLVEVAQDLMLSADAVTLHMNQGAPLNSKPDMTLRQLGIEEGETRQIHLYVNPDSEAKSPDNLQSTSNGKLPDELEVQVYDNNEDGELYSEERKPRIVKVRIEKDEKSRKLYLGGYRHKKTGTEYHHAACQVTPESEKRNTNTVKPKVEKFHRDTQTFTHKTRSIQTNRECGTQMERSDLVLHGNLTKLLTPRDYFTSEEHYKVKLEKTIIFQRFWRGYKARERANQIREALRERREQSEQKEAEAKEAEQKEHELNVSRRMNPKSLADFEILYNELEHWRQHEILRIESNHELSQTEKKKELERLLHKETKLLQTIDRLKLSANEENREKRIQKMLKLMAAPKKWQLSDGQVTTVHTPFTNRASELLELYRGINMEGISVDERLDVLLHVKWTVKEFDCNLTREIVDLIDREADLLHRGRSEKTMRGLRRRISNLFLQFIETPEFNPEAARFKKVPVGQWSDRPNIRPIRG